MGLSDSIEELDEPRRSMVRCYVERGREMHGLLEHLTRAYCAHCPRNLEYGCCDSAEEATREMPDEIVRLQEVESVENGGDLTSKNGICRYHTHSGCSLSVLKSPSCFGQICPYLRKDLFDRFGEKTQVFIDGMRAFGRASMEKEPIELLRCMDNAIRSGKALIQTGSSGEAGMA